MSEETTTPIIAESPTATLVTEAPIAEAPVADAPAPEVDVEALMPKGDYRTDPTFYAVADYFNIASEDYVTAKDYLSEIVEFAIRETKSNESVDIISKIREIEDKVQTPQWGEKRWWNIRKYIRLASRKSDIEKAMGAFSRKEA